MPPVIRCDPLAAHFSRRWRSGKGEKKGAKSGERGWLRDTLWNLNKLYDLLNAQLVHRFVFAKRSALIYCLFRGNSLLSRYQIPLSAFTLTHAISLQATFRRIIHRSSTKGIITTLSIIHTNWVLELLASPLNNDGFHPPPPSFRTKSLARYEKRIVTVFLSAI